MRLIASAFVVLASAGACTTTPTEPLDPLDPYGPPDPEEQPWLAAIDGTYYTRTTVSVSGTLPDTTLAAYASDPGSVLFAVAAAEPLPVLASLEAALPAQTFAHLPAWYDATVRENALGLLGVLALGESLRVLPDVMIESELVLAGGTARHTLGAMYLEPQSLEDRFALGMHDGEVVQAEAAVTATPTSRGGIIELAPHELVVALGAYRYELLEADSVDLGGARGMVGTLTMCPLVAAGIAKKCGTGECVAALPAFAELCERGLDAIVAATRDEVSAVRVRFGGGAAAVIDQDGDAVADVLEGSWEASESSVTTHLWFDARRPMTR